MHGDTLHIVAIPGSLREESLNRALASQLHGLGPDGVTIELFELHDVPLFNGDLNVDGKRPQPVLDLKGEIAEADAVILVTPEYNYGIPGVLKNAIDWASRPAFDSPFHRKPVGIMGVSPGAGGTMRAQEHLKLALLGMESDLFPHRGVAVNHAFDKFDDDLRLEEEETREFIADYLTKFEKWVRALITVELN